MNRLDTELQRLYACGTDRATRALVLGLARPADWAVLRTVWQGVQADLELPAPAIAVSGTDSYQLWFSLAQPVGLVEARRFLERLCQRYLPEVAPSRIAWWPSADVSSPASAFAPPRIPARQATSGNWSAFVSPDLPAVFGEDPWLDMAPGLDAQADLLSRMKSIPPETWAHALERLAPPDAPTAGASSAKPPEPNGHGPTDPRQFLEAVMNDTTTPLALRIEAAKALLAHPEQSSDA